RREGSVPVILLTGASRGLGLEFAKQYAADGWKVIATCRNPAKAEALRAVSGAVEIEKLDVTDFVAIHRLADKLSGTAIDVLIANAGITGPRDMAPDRIDIEAWTEVFRIDTMAPLALAGAFGAHVAKSRERKAIAITSLMGSVGANNEGGFYPYRSAKAAL